MSEKKTSNSSQNEIMQKLVSLCKRRGFIFQSSEIYGGLNSCWDYGPLGTELKLKIKKMWFDEMLSYENIFGLDASILMHPKVWEASGHIENFTDPLVDCKKCKSRFRSDKLEEGATTCPSCGGELTEPRNFNLMFKTFMGPVEDAANIVYMRPETAQGIYVNFQNVQQTMRQKLPMGIAQIGKAFRNEITPGNFIFRTREFEQMEMQFFVAPEEDEKWFNHWMETRLNWHKSLGIKPENLRFHEHGKGELAHYAKKAFDIEYNFPIGWNEVEGIHNRTDFDLNRHQQFSGKRLEYIDEVNKRRYIPYIIETSAGCDRTLLMTLCDAYREEVDEKGEERIIMGFHPKLAPTSLAIFPLMKKDGLGEFADKLYADFRKKYRTDYDASGSIGKRYRRQDEVGTPLCLTVDYDSITNNDVTVRHRDKMTQERVSVSNLSNYIEDKMANFNS